MEVQHVQHFVRCSANNSQISNFSHDGAGVAEGANLKKCVLTVCFDLDL